MKNKLFLFIAFTSSCLSVMADTYTAKDVFNRDEIVWYGLDFSKAKMIGQFDQGAGAGAASGSDLKMKYFPGWNAVILNEPKKYDLKKTFRKMSVFNDISPVEAKNRSVDV